MCGRLGCPTGAAWSMIDGQATAALNRVTGERTRKVRMLKEGLEFLVYAVYWLLPKFNYAVVFGVPDYEGSVLGLERRLTHTSLTMIIILVCGDPTYRPFPFGDRTKVVRKSSIRGLAYFLLARYAFFTHRCYVSRFPTKVVSVNMWHGMPLKRIGWMLDGDRGIASRYALATSAFWAKIMQRAMEPFDSVLVTGLPRNDLMFTPDDSVRARLEGPKRGDARKIVAWLPTYRKSVRGQIRQDGRESGSVLGIAGLSVERLNTLLNQNDALGVVKAHLMAPFDGCVELSNLLIVNDEWLANRALSLYELLGQSCLLVSDISSVIVDYLILDRPVVHLFPDAKDYAASRGFSIEPIQDYFVGPLATTAEELVESLTRALQGGDTHARQRRRVRRLFHDHVDGDSTRRLLEDLRLSVRQQRLLEPAEREGG